MNERIRELADRLWRIHPKDIDAMGLKTRKEFYEQELKKFAELIYKDIITVVAAQALLNESALDVFKNLKRIYEGVEE